MSVIAHLDTLQKKHDKLEQKIHDAYIHHLPVSELKKKKLQIKDEIDKLSKENEQNKKQAA